MTHTVDLEVTDSHAAATIILSEEDLIEDRLPLTQDFANALMSTEALTVDMIDAARPRSAGHAFRCRRVTGSFGEYGIALLGVDWPLEMRAGQRIDVGAGIGACRVGVYFSTI